MCRLIAVSTSEKKNMRHLVDALLVHFGQHNSDGTGIAFIEKGKLKVIKKKDPALQFVLNNNYTLNTNSCIGHLRAATSGGVSDDNAHPFLNEDKDLALVHNGMLFDYDTAKKTLAEKHVFSSNVDSEVLLHILEDEGEDFVKFMNKNGITGFANIAALKKDGSIIVYSDGDIYYRVTSKDVLVLQERVFKDMKELTKGWLMVLKDGKIVKKKNIGHIAQKIYVAAPILGDGGWHWNNNSTADSIESFWERQSAALGQDSSEIENQLCELMGIEFENIFTQKKKGRIHIEVKNIDWNHAKLIKKFFPFLRITNTDGYAELIGIIKVKKLKKIMDNVSKGLHGESVADEFHVDENQDVIGYGE